MKIPSTFVKHFKYSLSEMKMPFLFKLIIY